MSLVLNVEILGEYKNLTKATQGAEGTMTKLQGTFKKVGGAISKTLSGIGIGFAVAIASQVKPAIDAASDLAESVNAVEVSFGDAAEGILELGKNAATGLGLSQTELFGIATQFSSFAQTIAGDGGNIVGVVDDISTRGADFASVFNIDVADALGKFQSGLAGSSEPLRAYGIDLSAATVNAYALANGIGNGKDELTESEKVMARYGSLMEQTEKVTGDFANTSDSLANTQRIMNAEFENLRAEVGEALLPVMTELFTAVRDSLPDLKEMLSEVLKIIPAFVDFAKWALANKELILGITVSLVALNVVIKAGQVALVAYNVVAALFKAATVANTVAVGASTVAMTASTTATVAGTVAAGGFGASLAALAIAAAPWVLAIGLIALAFSNLKTNADEARAAVQALNAQKDSAVSSSGFSLSPGNQEYSPYSYNTPKATGTMSTGVSGQNNVTVNINRAKVDAQDIIRDINSALKTQGSTRLLR